MLAMEGDGDGYIEGMNDYFFEVFKGHKNEFWATRNLTKQEHEKIRIDILVLLPSWALVPPRDNLPAPANPTILAEAGGLLQPGGPRLLLANPVGHFEVFYGSFSPAESLIAWSQAHTEPTKVVQTSCKDLKMERLVKWGHFLVPSQSKTAQQAGNFGGIPVKRGGKISEIGCSSGSNSVQNTRKRISHCVPALGQEVGGSKVLGTDLRKS
ncbi:hypothetical protein B0H13DRAFT_1881991 [Mycena leptocephala]|nr:hypothetical protein B0H13DRAFT_1881991 [Mycena leptocephala]